MKLSVVGAAFAAGVVLVSPPQAVAQNWEPKMQNGGLICGYWPWASFAAVHNYNNAARSLCRWKCVYQLSSGQIHINAGARNLGPGEVVGANRTEKAVTGIVAKIDGAGSCVEAKDPRRS